MNVWTITSFENNYGSALQAFALQKKILELGGSPFILKRRPGSTLRNNRLLTFVKTFRSVKGAYSLKERFRYAFLTNLSRRRFKKIKNFSDGRIRVRELDDFRSFLSSLSENNDVLLAGSDQVWAALNRNAPSSFNAFVWAKDRCDIKKYSYAASIGLEEMTEAQIDGYTKALAHFSIVSFREKQAYEILKPYLGCPARCDLDPTLLHDGAFWNRFTAPRIHLRPYAFVYVLRPDNRVLQIARKIAKERNLDVVYVDNLANRPCDVIARYDLNVDEFLSGIQNAEFVITNSFHGAAFSTLFHKRFVAVKHPSHSTSSRISNLLNIVGLEERLIDSVDDWKLCLKEIDYSRVDASLEVERAESIAYLKEICTGRQRDF